MKRYLAKGLRSKWAWRKPNSIPALRPSRHNRRSWRHARREQLRMELLERRQLLAANPPQVLEVRWSPNVEQASQIEALRVQLDSPVQWNTASFDTSIEVFSLGLGQNVSFSTSTGDNATGSYLDVSFEPGSGVQTGDIASVITDGGFEFIIHADALTNVDAQTLDGNGDGIAGDAFVFDSGGEDRFAFRYGDFDGNGSVNLLDFAEFRRVFGTTIDPGSEETYFDANLDGQVNLLDFARFRTAFGQTTSYGSIDNVQLDEPLAAGVAQSINISTLATGFDGGAVHRINGQLAVVDEPVPVVGGTARLTNDGNVELTMDGSVEGEFGFGITFSDGMTSATAQISGEVVSADVVTADSRIEVFEDHSYAFWEPDFPYVSRFIGDTMESVEIVSLPEGNLLFDESPVTAGSIFSAADIAAGRLTYLPNSGPEGNQDAEFRFRVSDGVAWSGEGRVFIEVARSRYDVTDQIITQTLTPIELLDGETITRLGIGDQVGTEVSIENYTLTFDDDDIPIATFDENVEPFSFDVDLYNDDQLVRTLTLHMLPSGQAPMVRSDAVVVQRGSSMQLDLVANDPADNPAAVDRIALIHPLDGSEVTAWSDQGIALAVTENVVSVTASDSMLRSEHRFVLRYFNEQGVYRDAPLSVSVTEPAVTLDAMPDSITLDAGTFQLLDVLANDTSDSGTLNIVGVGRSAGGTFSKSLVDDGLRVEVRDGQILIAAKGTAAGRHNLYYAIDGGGSDQAIASLQIQINELDVAGYYGEVFFFNDSLSSRIPLPENASDFEVLSFYETDPELFAPGGTALQTSFGRVEINQNEIAIAERYEGDPASVDLVVGYLLDGQQQTNVLRLTHLGDLPAIEDVVLRFDQRDILIDVVPESLADQAIWLPSGIRQTDGSFASALVNGPVTATIESDRLRFVFDETASSFTDFEVDVSLLSDGGIQTIVNVKVRFELVGNPIITTLDSFNLANDVIVSTNLDVLSNDDPGDADEDMRIVGISTLSYGSFTSEAIGNGGRIDLRSDGTLDFTRTSGRSFNDWFYYQVVDDGGNEAIGWMQIIAAEDILQSDTYEIDFDQTESTFDPLSNDDLPAGSTLTGIRFGGTAYQTQIENDLVRASIVDGQLLIENLGNRIGTIPLQYEITSPAGLNLHAGSVSVSILPAGTPPTLVDDTFTLSEGAMVMDVDVLSNDDSGSSGALEIISLGPFGGTTSQVGNYGRVTLQPDGTLQYVRTHALSFGTDTFSYRAQNAGQHEAFANVQFVTTHPLTEPDSVEIDFDGETVTIDPLANDSLPDGFSVTGISSSFSVGNGDTTAATASWSAELVNGEIEITNLATLPTTSTLYYRIENSAGEFFARPTIPVSIVPVGQPAVANDDTLEITEVGLSFPIDVLANDDAIEPTESLQIIGVARYSGGPLASTQMGSFGSLSVAQDETLVYQRSSATAFGTDTFFYQVMDDGGNLATAQVSVTTNESLLNEDAIVVSLDELEGRFDLLENDFLPS
ncbi:MAG: Ig-like domain-containing protein, partial [Planctomycetota bacterium]